MSERFAKRIAERKRRGKLLENGEPGFEERGLVPLFPVGDTEALEEFGVGGNDFAVILIGEDGMEKIRFERPVEPVELFRREMGRGS